MTLAALAAAVPAACAGGWISEGSLSTGSAADPAVKDSGKPTETPTVPPTDTPTMKPTETDPTKSTDNSCLPLAKYFADKMFTPVMSVQCKSCHTASGVPSFAMDGGVDKAFAASTAMAKTNVEGASALIANPTAAVKHGGGKVFAADSAEAKTFAAFIAAVVGGKDCAVPPAG